MKSKLLASKTTARVLYMRREPEKLPHGNEKILNKKSAMKKEE